MKWSWIWCCFKTTLSVNLRSGIPIFVFVCIQVLIHRSFKATSSSFLSLCPSFFSHLPFLLPLFLRSLSHRRLHVGARVSRGSAETDTWRGSSPEHLISSFFGRRAGSCESLKAFNADPRVGGGQRAGIFMKAVLPPSKRRNGENKRLPKTHLWLRKVSRWKEPDL